ncbi:MAG TPA: hypothetical protein PKA63_00515 [Oligoflexia bacterium]|nr:hypothetical protein [Oligoflexia bacterium]HMP47132.1 hypothetical protein [Oligoflexia bacterium]
MASNKKTRSSTPRGAGVMRPAFRGGERVISEETGRSFTDSYSTLNNFKTPSELSQKDRELIISSVSRIHPGAGLMGVLESNNGRFPVAFLPGSNEPVILRTLPPYIFARNKEFLTEVFRVSALLTPLETLRLIEDNDVIIFERTFVPLVLENALRSSQIIPLKSIFDTLIRLFYQVERLHKTGLVHGHICPSNICFQGSLDGMLLDIGVNLISAAHEGITDKASGLHIVPQLLFSNQAALQDSFGLGRVLERVLGELNFSDNDLSPSRETLQSSLNPLISALTHTTPEKRPAPELGRLMLVDLLPMVLPGYEPPKINLKNLEQVTLMHELIESSDVSSLHSLESDQPEREVSDFSYDPDPVQPDDHLLSYSGRDSVDEMPQDTGRRIPQKSDFFSFRDDSGETREVEAIVDKSGRFYGEDPFMIDDNDLSSSTQLGRVTDQQTAPSSGNLSSMRFFIYLCLIGSIFFMLYQARERFSLFLSGSRSFFTSETLPFSVSSNYEPPNLGIDEMRAAWQSGVPSRMKIVAEAAVYSSSRRDIAESVILASLRQNELSPQLVDLEFLRTAFFHRWEDQLEEADRRYALSLGLLGVLGHTVPADLGSLEERNPAILLAVLSADSQVQHIVKSVSASVLAKLPSPYGTAFQVLTAGKPDATCASPEVISLARFATRGIEKPLEVTQFLKHDFSRRISSLAVVYSQNNDHARKLLDTIIEHPNFSLKNLEVTWARKVALLSWTELEPVDQLFLLAGVPLRREKVLSASTIAKLFLNPSPRVRGYASGLAVDAISFKHPAAGEILHLVHKTPENLSADQLVMLGQILEDPAKTVDVHRRVVHGFIASKPPLEIARLLLIGTARESAVTPLDSALSVYLADAGWSPDASDLLSLSSHPDKSTRMFAYQRIFQFSDKEHAALLLKESLAREQVPEFKEQLQSMISQLTGQPNQS